MEYLIEEIKDEIDAEFMDIVLNIEKLLKEFFVEEFVGRLSDHISTHY